MNIMHYGYIPTNFLENTDTIPARVTAVHKERYALICAHGETYARLKKSVYFGAKSEDFPTTGDFVQIKYVQDGDSLITATLPRRTFFSRRDPSPGRGEQAVAANFDYVFIIQSLNHDFNPKRLERYMTLSWQSGATPVVVLTKADLVEDWKPHLYAVQAAAVGADVVAVSAKTGLGLAELSIYVEPMKTIVFLGSSGVGKSSLVNALAGENIMAVQEIREDDSKGRHTTTHRQLIMLKSGAMVIDTPGMRELGMWDVSEGLSEAFSDVEQYLGRCKFSDCKHQSEPGCAIKTAIAIGALLSKRWESYTALKNEAQFIGDKAAYLRQKEEKFKDIAQRIKQWKK